MKIQNIKIDKPINVVISESLFEDYLKKNDWIEEKGLWRHKSGHQFAPLNLSNIQKALVSLADFEKLHIYTVWCKIMQPES